MNSLGSGREFRGHAISRPTSRQKIYNSFPFLLGGTFPGTDNATVKNKNKTTKKAGHVEMAQQVRVPDMAMQDLGPEFDPSRSRRREGES